MTDLLKNIIDEYREVGGVAATNSLIVQHCLTPDTLDHVLEVLPEPARSDLIEWLLRDDFGHYSMLWSWGEVPIPPAALEASRKLKARMGVPGT